MEKSISNNSRIYIAGELYNGNKIAIKDNLYGIIDKDYKIICEFIFSRIGEFHEDIAIVEKGSRNCGYIDIDGRIISNCIYEYAGQFNNGLAKVEKSYNSWTLINRFGVEILPKTYRNITLNDVYIIVADATNVNIR